jgi:hypothetical protein
MKEEDKLSLIRDILLTDDREFAEKIDERIKYLETTLNEPDQLSLKVDPIISKKLSEFTKKIPETLGGTITEALKHEIANSKDAVVDAMYPILGKMVKKYVSQEIKILSDKINNRLNWRKKIRDKFRFNKNHFKDSLTPTRIEQVLLIEQKSGVLVGSYSNTKTVDEEMISAMLTAIKAFVEDAYLKKEQHLELIEYELFKIHLQSFVNHYIAIVISGNYLLTSKDKIQNIVFDFYEDFTKTSDISKEKTSSIELKLEHHFSNAKI